MKRLKPLLDQLQRLVVQQAAIEAEITETRHLIEVGARKPSAHKIRKKRRSTRYGVPEGVQEVVKALKDAGKPLARIEVATVLNKNGSAVGFQLKQAIQLGFVERISFGKYKLTGATNAAI